MCLSVVGTEWRLAKSLKSAIGLQSERLEAVFEDQPLSVSGFGVCSTHDCRLCLQQVLTLV